MANTTKHYFYGIGRRKSTTARVRLMNGGGNILINGKSADEYFSGSKYLLTKLAKPFSIVELDPRKYDISVITSGGGTTGQVEAIQLAVSRAIVSLNEDLKGTLKRADLLGRDPREKERKKFGLKGARKQRQFTKR
jgi:small subunit ribosomal protein S9